MVLTVVSAFSQQRVWSTRSLTLASQFIHSPLDIKGMDYLIGHLLPRNFLFFCFIKSKNKPSGTLDASAKSVCQLEDN